MKRIFQSPSRIPALGFVLLLFVLIFSGCGPSVSIQAVPVELVPLDPAKPLRPAASTPTAAPAKKATAAAGPTKQAAPAAALATLVEVDFIDVGQGDAILIRSKEGQTALIDGGEAGSGVLAYLTSQGVTHLNLMVATHPHSDHIGGLVDVLGAMPVDRVVTNGQPHTSQLYERFLDGIIQSEAEFIEAKRGDVLPLGSLSFQVLNPGDSLGEDINNNSLVLRLVVGKVAFMFTGDAQTEAESSIVSSGLPLAADILKVGHHASHTSSSPAFLSAVQPSVAVYMAGSGNNYGHPHAETIAALTDAGVIIFGTDVNGTIAITTDGTNYQVIPAAGSPYGTSAPLAQNKPLSLEILSVTSPVRQGDQATVNARSAPGATCTITVHYQSGPSKAKGLESRTPDPGGSVSWSWDVGPKTSLGSWPITVLCSQANETLTQETTFEVVQ
jgi:beta-lactamase superfamily II metal-dependent hydrolase